MIMEEAEGRADFGICKNHSSKPGISVIEGICPSGISGVEDLCPSKLAKEMVMGPVTPFPDRENQVVSSPLGRFEEANPESGCRTPTGSTFDPFAPGPEGLMFAPKKKMLKKACPPIRMQLNFDSCCDPKEHSVDNISEETLEEESLLESLVSDAKGPEGNPGAWKEDTEGREDMDLCESDLSKVGISGVGSMCLSKTKNDTVLGPLTPCPETKNLHVSSPSDQTDERDLSNCRTPRGSTFDPFAPVPEGPKMFAPKKKSLKETNVLVQRKLNFDSCCDSKENLLNNISKETSEEEIFLVTVYESLLDVIISCQVREFIGESLLVDSSPFDCLKTPTSLPLLNGVAETCPGAPRPTSKSRKFNVNICRKLEF